MKENTKDEIRKLIHEYIKDNLKLEILPSHGGFTDPNGYRFVLKLDKEIISERDFTIQVRREYEG